MLLANLVINISQTFLKVWKTDPNDGSKHTSLYTHKYITFDFMSDVQYRNFGKQIDQSSPLASILHKDDGLPSLLLRLGSLLVSLEAARISLMTVP